MKLISHNTNKRLRFFALFAVLFLPFLHYAQAMTVNVNPQTQCQQSVGSTTSSAIANYTGVVTSFSWLATTFTGSCSPTISAFGNGSFVAISYSCCGAYGFTCTAYNSTTAVSAYTFSTLVNCPPIVNVTQNTTTLCQGSSMTLTATGAQSYTWNIGSTLPQITVTPTTTATYIVVGSSSSGCTNTNSATVNVIPAIVPNFTSSNGSNGLVNFSNTSLNTNTNTTYFWNFGNGSTSSSISPSVTYTGNGVYNVTLTANSSCGSFSTVQSITVTSIPGPTCAANYTYSGASGNYTFISTSAGTTTNTVYRWYFGNNTTYSAVGNAGVNPPVQSYTASGIYSISLAISNIATACSDSTSSVINVTLCPLNISFTSLQTASNTVNFTSTSTGTISTTGYLWNYGDGGSGTGVTSSHTYSANGVYIVTLSVTNNSNCTSSKTQTLVLNGCNNLSANFTHTMLANGLVNFNNTSSNMIGSTKRYWDFGDGTYSTANNPSHSYINAGTHYVVLKLKDSINTFCRDSLTQSINVTGITCSANANFNIVPGFTTQYWNAIPSYPYNVTAAIWYWGDGTQSNSLYASHLYSVAATYSICLSVTVSCGSNSTYCYPYYLYKSNEAGSQIISVNVVPPGISSGISSVESDDFSYVIYPNPNKGEFKINLTGTDQKKIKVAVYNPLGEVVYDSPINEENTGNIKTVYLANTARGIYFVRLSYGSKTYTQKVVIAD